MSKCIYEVIADGETCLIKRDSKKSKKSSLKLACCDCGLVHNVVINPTRKGIELTVARLPRETGGVRSGKSRRMEGIFKHG